MNDTTTITSGAPGQIRRIVRLVRIALTLFVLVASSAARVSAQDPTIGTVGLTPGWATFGQVVPPGVATEGLQVGSLPTQTDVKNRWPDGSIRFAVVTVHVPSAANYALHPGVAAAGTFTSVLPGASVAFRIGGDTYVAALPRTASGDVWLSGPLVHEARSVVAPVSAAGGAPHPFLRVNFDTRTYNDGQARVDISVENVVDATEATTISYDVRITVNGQSMFEKTGVEHYYLTRWRKTFEAATAPFALVTPDIVPFNRSGALPPYLPLVANLVYEPAGPNYEILQAGALEKNMPAHGGRPELAPYPNWTARYLVHRDPTQRAFVLANGDLSGSWPIHVREAEGSPTALGPERLPSLDQRPLMWYDERAQSAGWDYVKGTPLPIREYGTTVPGPGQTALIPDNAHQPSLAYVPYLMTGDRYYAEEMAFWANYAMLRTFPGDGLRGSTGLLQNNEVRGFGWALRNLVDAAAYYPDASPVKAYLSEKVRNNLRWIDEYTTALDAATNPFQIVWTGRRPEGPQYISLWEQTYLAHAIDRANQQGFGGGLGNRDAIARFQLRLFTSEPDYPRLQGAPYLVGVGTPGPNGFVYHTTMTEIWAASVGQERPFANFYGPEARINLIRAVEEGWPLAREAYDYLWPFIGSTPVFCPDGAPDMPDLACRAGWAIDFSSVPAPAPAPAQISSPVPGSTLASNSEVFNWDAGVGVTGYMLRVGTSVGADDLYAGGQVTTLSALVTGLPTNRSNIFVRLSSLIDGIWQHVDYTFTAADDAPAPSQFGISNIIVADGFETQTTAPFDTAAGDLLVAFVSSSGPAEGGQTMTVSGGDLQWTLAVRENGQLGVSEIWTAPTPTGRSGITVRSVPSFGAPAQSLVVLTLNRAVGAGAIGRANGPTGGPSVSLTTTGAGSMVFAVGNDWNGSVPRVIGPNQSMLHEHFYPDNDTFWVQRLDGTVAASGTTVTLNDTSPIDHIWNFAAIEIVPVSDEPPVVTWANPDDIVYGTALGAAQLNATANVPGTFAYTPPSGTVLEAGASQTLSATFTPQGGAGGPVTASVTLDVLKSTPAITWNAPATLVFGTPLGPTHLNATVNVPGTLVYTPPAGTILPTGAGQLTVSFTPADPTNYTTATATVPITVSSETTPRPAPAPIAIGDGISGTFRDATGHSGQSHLVFAPNARVWYFFTLSSAFDTAGNHTVRAYRSSGADLATATWTAATPSPHLANVGGATNSLFAGGRSLGVALHTIGTTDYVHIFASAAFDGQTSSNGHIRAQLGAGSITWGSWNNPGSPNTASEWQGPAGTGNSGASANASWGNSVGISTGGYIHHFSVVMDQEVDCSVGRSTNADVAATWTNGFGSNKSPTGVAGMTSPPNSTVVIDKTMTNECKVLSFASLASDVMLAVYSNGAVAQPNLTNLRYTRSGGAGTWSNEPTSGSGGDGNVFATAAMIHQNDWALVPVTTGRVYAFRRTSTGNAIEGASYSAASNTWAPMTPAPPAFAAGEAFKSGAGLFGATDGASVWLFFVNTDAANSILYSRFDGTSWTAWTAVPGTEIGTHTRSFVAGYPKIGGGQIGLVWTEGTGPYSVVTIPLDLAAGTPASSIVLTAPTAGVTVSGAVNVTATAVAGSGTIAGVQFVLDGVNLGPEDPASPFTASWDTTMGSNGTHVLSAIARDSSGGMAFANTVTVTVRNDLEPPNIRLTAPVNGAAVSGSAVVVAADASDDIAVVGVQFLIDGAPLGAEQSGPSYSVTWNSSSDSPGVHVLTARARDAFGRTTTSAPISVTVLGRTTPTISWQAPGDIVYGTALGPAQLDATASVPGSFVYSPPAGTVLPAGASHTLSVTFTPADTASYTPATTTVGITVFKATPTISWPTPADITEGIPLGAVQLNAAANVQGTFVYSPPAGTVLPAGAGQQLSLTFTPTDAANYTTATASVLLTVRPSETQPNQPPIDEIVLHAAAAPVVAGAWQVVNDVTAASGARLQNPDAGVAKRTSALAAPLDYFELTFLADAGKPYRLWIRGKALGDAYTNDSVFAQFDGSTTATGEPAFRIGTTEATYVSIEDCSGCGIRGWGWQDNAYGAGALGPVIYFATSGPQRLRIQVREDGIGIDQVVLSAVAYLTERPGTTKDDTTILPPTVSDAPPTVSLISPAAADSFAAPATIAFAADAFDRDGSIAFVEFYAGATLLDTRTSAPYAFTWTNVPAGVYPITARAVDNTGHSATSAVVSIVVESGAAIDEIVLHAAETSVVTGAWQVVNDVTAASGARLQNPDAGVAKRTTALAAPLDYFELTFLADAGKPYRLWIRGKALGDAYTNDSVFAQFDGSTTPTGDPAFRIGTTEATYVSIEDCSGCGIRGWGWQDNAYGAGALGPVIYFATSGPQRLRIQVREDGIGIDQIVLSAVAYLTDRPGATKDDTTILPRR